MGKQKLVVSEGPHAWGRGGDMQVPPVSPGTGSLRGHQWLLFRLREPGGFTDGGDTPLPVQTPNPTECLAKAQELPLHTREHSSAFAATAKWVFPHQRAVASSPMLRETSRGFLGCSMLAAEIPKILLEG